MITLYVCSQYGYRRGFVLAAPAPARTELWDAIQNRDSLPGLDGSARPNTAPIDIRREKDPVE